MVLGIDWLGRPASSQRPKVALTETTPSVSGAMTRVRQSSFHTFRRAAPSALTVSSPPLGPILSDQARFADQEIPQVHPRLTCPDQDSSLGLHLPSLAPTASALHTHCPTAFSSQGSLRQKRPLRHHASTTYPSASPQPSPFHLQPVSSCPPRFFSEKRPQPHLLAPSADGAFPFAGHPHGAFTRVDLPSAVFINRLPADAFRLASLARLMQSTASASPPRASS